MLTRIGIALIIGILCLTTVNTGIYAATIRDASVIYVDVNGDDQWDGTTSTHINGTNHGPKKTIYNTITCVPEEGTLKIGPGKYPQDHTIHIDKNIIIKGSGKNTVLTVKDNMEYMVKYWIDSTENKTNTLLFKDIKFSGESEVIKSNSNLGIIISDDSNLIFENCEFQGQDSSNTPEQKHHWKIISQDGDLSMNNCLISHTNEFINERITELKLNNCTIKDACFADEPDLYIGGIVASMSNVDLDGCSFVNNKGICLVVSDGDLKMEGTKFQDNACQKASAIIQIIRSMYRPFEDNTFINNQPKDIEITN